MARFYYRPGRTSVQPFKKEDIETILYICKKNRDSYDKLNDNEKNYIWDRNYMMIVLGINLAFRIGDILNLKVKDLSKGYVYIREQKTRKEQSFELNKYLKKDIESYINRNNLIEDDYMFKSRKGINKPITIRRARQIVKDLAEQAHVKYPVACHSLRKYYARQYYEQTGDIIGLKEMLNHSSERVTLLYICYDSDLKNEQRKNFYLGS